LTLDSKRNGAKEIERQKDGAEEGKFHGWIPFGTWQNLTRPELSAKGQGYFRAVRPWIWPNVRDPSQSQISTFAKIPHLAKQSKFFFGSGSG
jgi:hypothetical protein